MSQRISMTTPKEIEKEDFDQIVNRTKKDPDLNYEIDWYMWIIEITDMHAI